MKYVETLKSFIKQQLLKNKGCQTYVSVLWEILTNDINNDDTYTYSRDKAKKLIIDWWDDCAEFVEYYKEEFPYEEIPDPFEEERFICKMMIIGTENLLNQLNFVYYNKNNEITLDDETIQTITDEVNHYNEFCSKIF